MTVPHPHGVGSVVSADIAVPEHARELQFYARVLTTGTRPLWREDLMNSMGIPVIGLGPKTEEYAELPLQWMPHIQVADIAASASRAVALGGREWMHQRDAEGRSQWAVLVDPGGAWFGIIPVVASPDGGSVPGGGSTEPVGRISGLELTVPDAASIRDFYREVVGWSVREVEAGRRGEAAADHAMATPDGTPVARIRQAREVHPGPPPVWLICLPVGDLAESLARVRAEGGAVVEERSGPGGEPAYAVIRDPVGAHLALTGG